MSLEQTCPLENELWPGWLDSKHRSLPSNLEETIRLKRPSVFGSSKASKTLLVTVAIHGDEPCGLHALRQLYKDGFFEKDVWEIAPYLNEVILIVGNPRAVEQSIRYIDVNLNRIFETTTISSNESDPDGKKAENQTEVGYEYTRRPIISSEIERSDWYLDIHSTSAPSAPFAIPISTSSSFRVAEALPVEFVLESILDTLMGTSMHAAVYGAHLKKRIAVCVECGKHDDPAAQECASRVIRKFIAAASAYTSLNSNSNVHDRSTLAKFLSENETRELSMLERKATKILKCTKRQELQDGFQFLGPDHPHAFEHVKYNQLIARDSVSGDIRCPYLDGAYLIMPTAKAIVGEEAWFWGIEQR